MAKRIISFVLIACILLSVALPLSIYAAPSVDGSDGNTSRFYNKQSNTGLDAYPGSAKVDGLWDENDEWDNALPLTLNATTKELIRDCGMADTYDGDFYLLWDENGLYVMEVQRQWRSYVNTYAQVATGSQRPWRTTEANRAWGTQIYISPNTAFVSNSSYVRGVFVWETSTSDTAGTALAINTPVRAVVTQRNLTYTSAPGAVSGSYYTPTSIDGVTSYFAKTAENAYVMETFLSWDYLGMNAPGADATEDLVDALGIKLGMGFAGGTHLSAFANSSEGTGLDPITLRAEPNAVEAAITPKKIDVVAAENYWTDVANGQFIVNADATEYEIATAEQLLGLSLAMENNSNDEIWTKGKTFKLIEDVDLNPGVDWKLYRKQQLDPLGNVCEHYIAEQTPTNEWLSLDNFYGSIDGQGHTVNGLWTPEQSNGIASDTAYWGVFGGQVYGGNAIKNLVLDNGYLKGDATANQFAGVVGVIRKNPNGQADTYALQNIDIGENYTVDASAKASGAQIGAFVCGWYDSNKITVFYDNLVFGGHLQTSEHSWKDGIFTGDWNLNGYVVTMTDCIVTGTYGGTLNAAMFGGTQTNCYDFANGKEQAIPEGLEGKYIETSEGIMPVSVADMLMQYAYQSTTADESGKYSIRIVGEVASMAYDSVDFAVKITKADGTSAVWGYGVDGYTNAETVFNSVMANGISVSASALNQGFLDGETNKLYVLTLNDLVVDETYTIDVSTVWTLLDGTVIKGGAVKTVTPEAWIEVDGINLADGYKVVIGQTATNAVKQLASDLVNSIEEKTQVKLDRVTDNTAKTPVTEKEILLSVSNRPQTQTALASLNKTGYSITFSDEKLVVVASNDFMLEKAVSDLESRLLFPNQRAIVNGALNVTYDGSGDMFALVNNGTFKYDIVYPRANANYEKEMAEQLKAAIASLLNCTVNDPSSDPILSLWGQKENALLVGKTNYTESTNLYNAMGLSDIRWKVEGNRLAIGADITTSLDEAMIAFFNDLTEVVKGTYDGKYMLPNGYSVQFKAYDWMASVPKMAQGSYLGADDVGDDSIVFVWENVTESNYDAYLSTLKNSGFAEKQTYTLGENRYMLLESTLANAYAYYVPGKEMVRLFVENKEKGTLYPSATPTTYETVEGYQPTLWQVECDWKTAVEWDTSAPEGFKGSNAGMCYILRVADGSFVIIDSGMNSKRQGEIIYEHLKRHSGEEKPVISAWFFSHNHADHTGGFQQFTSRYKDEVVVKAFYHNFPANGFGMAEGGTGDANMISLMKQYSGATIYRKLHTGMTFYVADARFDVMYTHEDLYPVVTGEDSLNEATTVLRLTFGGQRIMFLGDVMVEGGQVMLDTMPKSEMKSDIVQYAHHGWDGPEKELYDLIEAPTVMWPNAIYSWQEGAEGENIFHRLITQVDWAYFYEVNHYIAYEAEYVKTIIINAEGTGTQEFILPYTPRAERLPDYEAIYEEIKAKQHEIPVREDYRNDFGPVTEF